MTPIMVQILEPFQNLIPNPTAPIIGEALDARPRGSDLDMTVFREQYEFIRSPSEAASQLVTNQKAMLIGFRNVLAMAILYWGAILLWALGSEGVTLPPFLRIPEDQYYFYELIFLIPMFIVTWLLASGIAYVMSKVLGGSGPFDAILGGFGLSMAISFYFSLIPDYIQGILWTTGLVPFYEYLELTSSGLPLLIVWTYLTAWLLTHLVLYSITVRQAQGLSRARSALVAIVSFLGSFAVWITIVR